MNLFKDKKFYLYLGIVLLFFGLLVKINYSVDTYLLLSSPKLGYVKEYISSGRIFTFLFFSILGFLRLPYFIMYLLSYLLANFIATLSIYELHNILKKYISNNILAILLPISIIINPFIIELWLFIETGIMMLSILASIKAYKYFDKYLEIKDSKYLKYTFIWTLVGLFSYQGTIALFIALSIFSILKYSKDKKEFIKNNIIMLVLYSIPTIINYLFITLFSRNRVGGNYNITKTFQTIGFATIKLIDGFGLFFKGFISIFLIISIILVIYYIIKNKDQKKILSILYIILMIYIFTILPIIPQTGEKIAVYPRTCYAFLTLISFHSYLLIKKITIKYYQH